MTESPTVIIAPPVTPTDWCVYETPSGHDRVGLELDCPRLREDIAAGRTVEEAGIADSTAFVRLGIGEVAYEVRVPLDGAPTWWVKRAKREGFAFALVPVGADGQVPFLATRQGEPDEAPAHLGYVRAGRYGTTRQRPGEKVGRNEPCPCGSGQKLKRCHGAVDA